MKIAIINKSDKTGGAAVAAMRLAFALRNNNTDCQVLVQEKLTDNDFVKAQHTKYLAAKINKLVFLVEAGFFFLFAKSRAFMFRFSPAFAGTGITNKADISVTDAVHVHWINQGYFSFNSIKKLLNANKPVVWTLHDMWLFTGGCHYAGNCKQFEAGCENCPLTRFKFVRNIAKNQFNNKLNLLQNKNLTVVTCSNWLKLEAQKSPILAGVKVLSIPNPIDTQIFFKVEKDEARKRFNLPANKKLLLFGAANIFDERKGYKYFVKALNLLKNQITENEYPEIVFFGKIKSEAINIPFNYHILNYIGNVTDLRLLYSAADLFIIPSLEDNLPNTIMESMACGTPVVAFATGGIPEMIDHLQNGFLAETKSSAQLAQGIEQLLYTENLTEYSKNAIQKVETSYSEKVVAEQYIEVYKSVIAK